MKQQEFIQKIQAQKDYILQSVNNDEWRNAYHLMAPIGWINDPNGLCYFKGEYHVFYQYSPLNANGGLKFWGHYTSKDLVNWTEHDVALYPDIAEDIDGVYSGSAIVHNDEMYLIYTGNVKHTDGDYDYILSGREQNVIVVKSSDGYHFSDKTVVLRNEDYPSNMGLHVRDPKVWKEDDTFYMVLGARSVDDQGYVLLYQSKDLFNWEYVSTPAGGLDGMGYMWECPDLVKINNQDVFIFSPQGLDSEGYKYQNVYQSGYALASFDESKQHLALGEFIELDRGFDFYAPQTFVDEQERVIMIGWMGVPDAVEHVNPTVEKGWQHALTLPRELKLINNKLYQVPVEELKSLRKDETKMSDLVLGDEVSLELFQSHTFELKAEFSQMTAFKLGLRHDCELVFDKGVFTLSLGRSGYGRDARSVEIDAISELTIYSDQSVLEIYLNGGEEVFTTRIYNEGHDTQLSVSGNGSLTLTKWEL
ncbi:MAG TPA: sucrose-6-phosphate hydrolase [Firmicutes bacterium]|nr:sucrose-6-phosphate hydrolase [Bacillota bacterium]